MNKTLEYFDFQSDLFDVYQTRCVPRYEEMVEMSVGFLSRVLGTEPGPRVLDLGCGTGNTSIRLRETFPRPGLVCVDGSAEMLARAKAKLATSTQPSPEFLLRDLALEGWAASWADDVFEAIVSVLVLEHLPFDAHRGALNQCARILKPGGWLVTVEGYEAGLLKELYWQELVQSEERAVTDGLIPKDWLDEMKNRSRLHEKHYFTTMAEKRQWWLDAGLLDVDFVWSYYCVGVLVGRKSG